VSLIILTEELLRERGRAALRDLARGARKREEEEEEEEEEEKSTNRYAQHCLSTLSVAVH
jgi:hypothetical protein